jgi:hypothetical protein
MSKEYYAQRIIDGLEPHEADSIARGLEDDIEARGLQDAYTEALDALVNVGVTGWRNVRWAMLRATPEQRARAYLKARGL